VTDRQTDNLILEIENNMTKIYTLLVNIAAFHDNNSKDRTIVCNVMFATV